LSNVSNINKEKYQSNKFYVFGSRDNTVLTKAVLQIGRFHALDGSLGAPVYFDISHPHIILVMGKRGYGKSYTLGVFLEEMQNLDTHLKNQLSIIVIDTLGIFWTMNYSNKQQTKMMEKWNIQPTGFPIHVFTADQHFKQYQNTRLSIKPLTIQPSSLSPEDWCNIFDVSPIKPVGSLIYNTILHLRESQKKYNLSDIIQTLWKEPHISSEVKIAAENLLKTAKSWGVFHQSGISLKDIIKPGQISLIDLSAIKHQPLKILITGLIADDIFESRIKERKKEELATIGLSSKRKEFPLIYLAIDEAHLFLPKQGTHNCKKILIEKWLRQGRQPGLSMILGTQLPGSIDSEVFSHSDFITCHRLTALEDIKSLQVLRPTYLHEEITETLKKIGRKKGVALVIDDISESSHIIRIRPRMSWHGGNEPTIKIEESTGTLNVS